MDVKLGRAWLLLCLALMVHVADEALTNFLSVYNPAVEALRARAPWLPIPTFGFGEWIGGLASLCAVLLLLTPAVYRGARWVRPLAYVFAAIMTLNALGHTAGTIAGRGFFDMRIPRPMPGFYSSPLLLAASLYLFYRLRFRKNSLSSA